MNVTNPTVGTFICALVPQLPPGSYRFVCVGTGFVEAASEELFDILESGVLAPVDPTVPITGPCSSWISGSDVAAFGSPISGVGEDTYLLDDVAYGACSILYELTARQFPGVCTRTVRPSKDTCACFGQSIAAGLGPWYWSSAWFGGYGGYWYDECGNSRGCGAESTLLLGGYPVRKILAVKIAGVDLPEFDPDLGYRNWRLDDRRKLMRMSIPATSSSPVQPQWWPICQDMSLDDDQPGTFSIEYEWGADVPWTGRQAACQLARELYAAGDPNQTCKLPSKVTKVVRAGITMDKVVSIAQLLRQGSSGLQLVDAFIAQVNPDGRKMRSAVWSPDRRGYAKKYGQ